MTPEQKVSKPKSIPTLLRSSQVGQNKQPQTTGRWLQWCSTGIPHMRGQSICVTSGEERAKDFSSLITKFDKYPC